MIAPNDYVKVQGTAYQVPPKASRDSMETMMLGDATASDTKVKLKAAKYQKSAKGIVDQRIIGKVLTIKDDLAVVENAVSGQIEHALIDNCEKIKICKMCGQREAGNGEYCSKAACKARARKHR